MLSKNISFVLHPFQKDFWNFIVEILMVGLLWQKISKNAFRTCWASILEKAKITPIFGNWEDVFLRLCDEKQWIQISGTPVRIIPNLITINLTPKILFFSTTSNCSKISEMSKRRKLIKTKDQCGSSDDPRFKFSISVHKVIAPNFFLYAHIFKLYVYSILTCHLIDVIFYLITEMMNERKIIQD